MSERSYIVMPMISQSNERIGVLYQQGKYTEAAGVAENVLKGAEKIFGAAHSHIVLPINDYALFLDYQGKYQDAEVLFKNALQIYSALKERDRDKNTGAILYNNYGRHCFLTRQLESAQSFYADALVLIGDIYGVDQFESVPIYNNVALLNAAQGVYSEAETVCQKALSILSRYAKGVSVESGCIYNTLGTIFDAQLCIGEAETAYQRAIEIFGTLYTGVHPHTGSPLYNIAALYDGKKEFKASEGYYKRVMEIYEKSIGSHSPDMVRAMQGLAHSYTEQKRNMEAVIYYKRVLDIIQGMYGEESLAFFVALEHIAVVYDAQDKPLDVVAIYKRLLGISERVFGKESVETAEVLEKLSAAYTNADNAAQARVHEKRARAIRGKIKK